MKEFMKRVLISLLSSIAFSIVIVILFILFFGGVESLDDMRFVFGLMALIAVYSLLVYLVLGIPISYLIDYFAVKRNPPTRARLYLVKLYLYSVAGIAAGLLSFFVFGYGNHLRSSDNMEAVYISLIFTGLGIIAALLFYHISMLFNKRSSYF